MIKEFILFIYLIQIFRTHLTFVQGWMDKCVYFINILLQQDRNTGYCIAKVLQLSYGSLVLQGNVTNPGTIPAVPWPWRFAKMSASLQEFCAGMVLWPRFGHPHTAPPGQICNRALISIFKPFDSFTLSGRRGRALRRTVSEADQRGSNQQSAVDVQEMVTSASRK